jgi:argininosuccinate lyase
VRYAQGRGIGLADLSLAELQGFAGAIAGDVTPILKVEGSVAARDHVGGTAPRQVEVQVGRWRERLAQRDSV